VTKLRLRFYNGSICNLDNAPCNFCQHAAGRNRRIKRARKIFSWLK
jgi:hypothetical protein